VAVIWVGLLTVAEAVLLPNFTTDPAVKLAPAMTTDVPPAKGPAAGEIDDKVGSALTVTDTLLLMAVQLRYRAVTV
jgi:hypothetical protein